MTSETNIFPGSYSKIIGLSGSRPMLTRHLSHKARLHAQKTLSQLQIILPESDKSKANSTSHLLALIRSLNVPFLVGIYLTRLISSTSNRSLSLTGTILIESNLSDKSPISIILQDAMSLDPHSSSFLHLLLMVRRATSRRHF